MVGTGPPRFKTFNLSNDPIKGQKSSRGRSAKKWPSTKFDPKKPWPEQTHCRGQKSHRGHAGSIRGQIAYECPMATKFDEKKTSSQNVTHYCGQRSGKGHQGQTKVKLLRIQIQILFAISNNFCKLLQRKNTKSFNKIPYD